MKKKLKRILSALLVAVMLVGIAPVGGIDFTPKAKAMDLSSYKVGDLIEFGSYPQSEVKDSDLIAKIEAAGASISWIDYNYYAGTGEWADGNMKPVKDMMLYKDITYNGNKYRAVKINQYRPCGTGDTSSASNSYQDDNGYYTGNTYYFKYEPLTWRVLDASTGLVVCDSIIDSQPYNNYEIYAESENWGDSENKYYASNWENSSIRAWLNNDFYNTAFSETQQDEIQKVTWENKSAYMSRYDSNPTSDKITLLSYDDVLNTSYGFSSSNSNDTARYRKGTDYAKCQGLNSGLSDWWRLRSAINSDGVVEVTHVGLVNDFFTFSRELVILVRALFRLSNLIQKHQIHTNSRHGLQVAVIQSELVIQI